MKNSRIYNNRIIDELKKPEVQIKLVHEFFNGQYTEEEVHELLTAKDSIQDELALKNPAYNDGSGMRTVDRVTLRLAEEFRSLPDQMPGTVQEWYRTTPLYVFDLLKWNTTQMFLDKYAKVDRLIRKQQFASMVDFGGVIGITAMLLAEASHIPAENIIYVDLKGSPTFNFAKFLFDKFGFSITMMDPEDLYRSNTQADAVLALDVLEHIVDIEHHVAQLSQRFRWFLNFNEFTADPVAQPQHIHTSGDIPFAQTMIRYHYFPEDFPVLFRKKVPQWAISQEPNGQVKMEGPQWYDI